MQSISPSQPVSPSELVARPSDPLRVGAAILGGLALILPFSALDPARPWTFQGQFWPVFMVFAMTGLPALAVGWYSLRCRITANDEGLTFRELFGTRFVPWTAIEDYELRLVFGSASTSKPAAYLKIRDEWKLIPNLYSPRDALLERIAQKAKWSRSQSWQRADQREDRGSEGLWSKTFTYPAESGWKSAGNSIYIIVAGNILVRGFSDGFTVALTNASTAWNSLSWWGRSGIVIVACLAGVFGRWLGRPKVPTLNSNPLRNQEIEATPQGLTFKRESTDTYLPWSEITSYHLEKQPSIFQPVLYVIQSHGQRLEFVSGLNDTAMLLELVQSHASNATTKTWLYPDGADGKVLGGGASLWRDGTIGLGPKIHHYRTRASLFNLYIMGFLILWDFAEPIIKSRRNEEPLTFADFLENLPFLLLVCGVALYSVLSYRLASLQCEEKGLRQNSVWGKKFIAWEKVEKFEFNAMWYIVTGHQAKIRFSLLVADLDSLKDEIELRSGQTCRKNETAF